MRYIESVALRPPSTGPLRPLPLHIMGAKSSSLLP